MYQSLLHLSWVDNLLDVVRSLFVKEYGRDLKKSDSKRPNLSGFTATFEALVAKLDRTSGDTARSSENESASAPELTPPSSTEGTEDGQDEPPPPPVPGLRKPTTRASYLGTTSTDATPIATPETSRPSSPAVNSHLLTATAGPGGRGSRRARRTLTGSAPTSSGDEAPSSRRPANARKQSGKSKRRWDADGFTADGDEDEDALDYSSHNVTASEPTTPQVEDVRIDQMGSRTGKGQFVLKDLDDEVDAILAETKAQNAKKVDSSGLVGSSLGAISGYFRNVVGGKTLTKDDLQKPLKELEDHLLRKNVAREAAVRLCEGVERDLLGMKTSNFTSQ